MGMCVRSGQLLGPIRESLDLLAKESKGAEFSTPPVPLSEPEKRLKIGIVGFGKFGQFLAKTFTKHHEVFAVNKDDQVSTPHHTLLAESIASLHRRKSRTQWSTARPSLLSCPSMFHVQTALAAEMGVTYFPLFDVTEFFRKDLDVVLFSVSILAFEDVSRHAS